MSTGAPTVAELVDRYLHRLSPRGTSARSASILRRHLHGIGGRAAAHLGIHPDELTVHQLSPVVLRSAFRAWSLDRGPVSLRRTWRTWHRFFDALVADGVVPHNPLTVAEPTEPAPAFALPASAAPGPAVSELASRTSGTGESVWIDNTSPAVTEDAGYDSRREPAGLAASVAAHPAQAILRRAGFFVPG